MYILRRLDISSNNSRLMHELLFIQLNHSILPGICHDRRENSGPIPFPFPEPGRNPWLNACGKVVLNGKNWPGGQRTSAGPILCRFCKNVRTPVQRPGFLRRRNLNQIPHISKQNLNTGLIPLGKSNYWR